MKRPESGRLRRGSLGLLVLALPLLAGCFGKFQVTRNVHAFNKTVSEQRFVRSGVFVAMNAVPVNPVGLVLDVFLVNPVEFWTGVNPVKGSKRWFPEARVEPGNAALPHGADAERAQRAEPID